MRNRFREARKNRGGDLQDQWLQIEAMKHDRDAAKQRCLFRWVQCRGFTQAFFAEINTLSHIEILKKGK